MSRKRPTNSYFLHFFKNHQASSKITSNFVSANSNIFWCQTYKSHTFLFWKYQKMTIFIFCQIPNILFNFEENTNTLFDNFWRIHIFVFLNFHNFHCLGSHEMGHLLSYQYPRFLCVALAGAPLSLRSGRSSALGRVAAQRRDRHCIVIAAPQAPSVTSSEGPLRIAKTRKTR